MGNPTPGGTRTRLPTGPPAGTLAAAGVGYSENSSSREAGREAARRAVHDLGDRPPDLVLLFQTSKHDPSAFHAGVRSVVGEKSRLLGGYGVGIITNDRLGYEGHQVGVAALSLPAGTSFSPFLQEGLDTGEEAAGRALGERIAAELGAGDQSLLLFYDAVKEKRETGYSLNMATPLLAGLGASLERWPRTAGVGMLGDVLFHPTHQFFDERVVEQSAIALLLGGGVRMDTVIMHGCKPSGSYRTVTAAEENAVLEIDGRPALAVVKELLGPEVDREIEEYPLFLTLGQNHGDPWAPFEEENYSNHICAGLDEERGALIMFEPTLTPGTRVQVMRRTFETDYVGERAEKLLAGLDGRRPFFGFYIDCAIRASAFCDSEGEEAWEVQRVLTEAGIPLLGIYSGVEIAEVRGEPRPLDYTGVLCVLSEAGSGTEEAP